MVIPKMTLVAAFAAVLIATPASSSVTDAAPPPTFVGPATALVRAVRLDPPVPTVSPVVSEMVDLVNAERSARGLAPMSVDARLGVAAQRHSEDQAAQSQMTHIGSDGSTIGVRVDRVGYPWRSVAENVAYGYPDAVSVMAGWMASDGHRRNLLSNNTQIGIGLAVGADGRPYWTQVFAAPS